MELVIGEFERKLVSDYGHTITACPTPLHAMLSKMTKDDLLDLKQQVENQLQHMKPTSTRRAPPKQVEIFLRGITSVREVHKISYGSGGGPNE